MWALAISQGLKLSAIANTVLPYPTCPKPESAPPFRTMPDWRRTRPYPRRDWPFETGSGEQAHVMPEKPAKTKQRARGRACTGLSGKVLALTIVFVMLGEVLIFLPSIANFRIQWLKSRIAQAEIAALAAEAAPDRILTTTCAAKSLRGRALLVVSLQEGREAPADAARRAASHDRCRPSISARVMYYNTIADAFGCHGAAPKTASSASSTSRPTCRANSIEIALQEEPLQEAMRATASTSSCSRLCCR